MSGLLLNNKGNGGYSVAIQNFASIKCVGLTNTIWFMFWRCFLPVVISGVLPQLLGLKVVVRAEGNEYPWNRSSLIYHDGSRRESNWKRHLVRISENGAFTSKWLFDHAIITSADNMESVENAESLKNVLANLIQDAKDLDSSMRSLPRRSFRFKISIGCPYVKITDSVINLDGKDYNPSKMEERQGIQKWYIKKVNDFRLSNSLQYSEIIGMYYHKEDAVEAFGDIPLIQEFNRYVHELGMASVWVPYYNAPFAFEGRSKFNFDIVIVQPSYAFLSSIDASVVKGDRLYSMGYKTAEINQCYEYEIRSAGESKVENWIAHQYLAVAQETGAWKFPQTFFVGTENDLFDIVENKSVAESRYGSAWEAYTDLVNYLEGKKIGNLEAAIPLSPNSKKRIGSMDVWETFWRVPKDYSGLSSIRFDFKDKCGDYWTGSVVVYVERPDGSTGSSFTHRAGPDVTIPSLNSVFVPLADKNITEGSLLRITIQKPSKSLWPIVLRLVAAKKEPMYIGNPLFEEISSSSKSCPPGPDYIDSVPSHKGYGKGKLTDGKVSPGGWLWDGVLGWFRGQFIVIIDLGKITSISKIQIWTHKDETAGVNVPVNIVGLVSSSCIPHITGGTMELNCFADAMTGKQTTTIPSHPDSRLINLPFSETVRGRYVSVSGVIRSWALLDEIQVLGDNNAVISTGSAYRLNPVPGNSQSGPDFCDNSRRLTDGIVLSPWIFAGNHLNIYDGIQGSNGYVETLLDTPKKAKYAIVWMTQANTKFGVEIPPSINIQWRNTNNVWSGDNRVTVFSEEQCGPSPCAKLQLPGSAILTGVRATFPSTTYSWSWFMITEISII